MTEYLKGEELSTQTLCLTGGFIIVFVSHTVKNTVKQRLRSETRDIVVSGKTSYNSLVR